MASSNLTIDVSDDAFEIFKATRMIHCQEVHCKNNSVSEHWGGHAECRLKRIYIVRGGQCEQYEPKEADDKNPSN